jgi:DNA-binding response OmpR family regulator
MTVLIIEDDEGLAELIKRIVQKCGFKAINVYSGAEALQWLSGNFPKMVLLDYRLPDMNANEFISDLKDRGLPVPAFIVSTGYCDERVATEMMNLGASDYLVKDSGFLERLPNVIRGVAQGAH